MASRLSFSLALLVGAIILLSSTASARHMRQSHPRRGGGHHKRGGGHANAADMTRASIMATISKTKQARGLALKIMGIRSPLPMWRGNLDVCQQVYGDALTDLQTSLKSLNAKALDDLNINLSAVLTDFTTCDDAYADVPGMKSPLALINSQLNALSSNNLKLASALH